MSANNKILSIKKEIKKNLINNDFEAIYRKSSYKNGTIEILFDIKIDNNILISNCNINAHTKTFSFGDEKIWKFQTSENENRQIAKNVLKQCKNIMFYDMTTSIDNVIKHYTTMKTNIEKSLKKL